MNRKNTHTLLFASAIALLSFLIVVPDAKAQSCSWDDWDQGATVVQGGAQVAGYAGQIGWTRWWWPNNSQLHCENWPNPADWRLYFRDSFVANPANNGAIRLRYLGPHSGCAEAVYAADYLQDGAGAYLRITLSSNANFPWDQNFCSNSDYVMVAP